MTYWNAGLPRQCWSKASSRMYWSRFHSTSFQGPVPTAAVLPNASSPTFSTCFFGTMGKNTTRSRSSGKGLSVMSWTVSASTIFTSLIARTLPYWGDFFFSLPGSSTRSNENFTSSAVMVEPSWNLTPLRSLNSHVVSLTAFHDTASDGSNSSLALRCRSESNMLMLTRMPTRSKCMCGSRVGACEGSATVSVSLPWARHRGGKGDERDQDQGQDAGEPTPHGESSSEMIDGTAATRANQWGEQYPTPRMSGSPSREDRGNHESGPRGAMVHIAAGAGHVTT